MIRFKLWLWFFNLCSTDGRHEISFTVTTVFIANFFKIWNRQRSFIVRWSSWIVKSSRVIPFQDDELLKYSFTIDLRLSSEKISIINTLSSLMISSSYFAHQFETVWLLLHIQFRISNIFSLWRRNDPDRFYSTTNNDDDYLWYDIFDF